MNKLALRKFHRYFALVLSPLIIGIAISGSILLLHHHGTVHFPEGLTKLVFNLHTWSYFNIFIALVVPLLLIILALSGIALFVTTLKK